ncbi:MAG TPA: DUF3617 family protein [Caulobacteraceae bacterium]|jgi:hypothetical protein|nr:DUF3617 family protein [Caulobacteraceae bacterium]
MRAAVPFLALAALCSLGACNRTHSSAKVAIPAPATEPAVAGPQLTAGLWRQRVMGGHGVSVTRYCLDAAAATALASFNQQLGGRCSEHQMALSSDGAWHFKTACDAGGTGKVITEGTMRGDFATHYVVEASQQSAGAAARVTADIRRLGDCPSGMKPGDVILPGGLRTRLSALPANA